MKRALISACITLLCAISCYAETIETVSVQPTYEPPPVKTGYVLFIIPQYNFMDDEYTIPKVNISRAGYTVEVASSSTKEIAIGADIMKVRPNLSIEQIDPGKYKGVIMVGGWQSKKFYENPVLIAKMKEFNSKGILIGAMDNMPLFLAKWGLLKDVKATVHPALVRDIKKMGINYVEKDIVIDKNIITVDKGMYSDPFAGEFIQELDKR